MEFEGLWLIASLFLGVVSTVTFLSLLQRKKVHEREVAALQKAVFFAE